MFAVNYSSSLASSRGVTFTAQRRHQTRRSSSFVTNAQQQKQPTREVDDDYNIEAGIEPCLVGYVDKDSNGVEMYCCEQPDGTLECRTMTPEHEECEIFDENGDVKVECSPNLTVERDK